MQTKDGVYSVEALQKVPGICRTAFLKEAPVQFKDTSLAIFLNGMLYFAKLVKITAPEPPHTNQNAKG